MLHAVLNVTKRLVVVIVGSVLSCTPLTTLQVVGLTAANAGTLALTLLHKRSQQHATSALQQKTYPLDAESLLKTDSEEGRPKPSSQDDSPSVQGRITARLTFLSAGVIALCLMCLAAVLVTFAQGGAYGPSIKDVSGASLGFLSSNVSSNSSEAPNWTVSQFVVRDDRRLQCLNDLHHASKVRGPAWFDETSSSC